MRTLFPQGIEPVAVKVACINWGHPGAPKAVAYALGSDGSAYGEQYCESWAAAMRYAGLLSAALGSARARP